MQMRLEICEMMKRGSASLTWGKSWRAVVFPQASAAVWFPNQNVNREALSLQRLLNGLSALLYSIPTDFPPDEREQTLNTK